jgi:magnesium chelatase family protein
MTHICLHSLQFQGLQEQEIRIEALKSRGLPQLTLMGLPNNCLKESREKIKTLVSRLETWGPMDKVLVQLSPTDATKLGVHLEVPIALATLAVLSEGLSESAQERLRKGLFAGSMGLDGRFESSEVTSVCQQSRKRTYYGPHQFRNLESLWTFFKTEPEGELAPLESEVESPAALLPAEEIKVHGRWEERFWLAVAATAELPVLMLGNPGVGKTHLAKWAASLLPPPQKEEESESRQIWKLAGEIKRRPVPLVQPHARSHISEFVGCKRQNMERPGYFAMAHSGLLVLDEFAEMNRDIREILRNVLDQKKIQRNTSTAQVEWPANFWLILTANPCPCGYAEGLNLARCNCPASARLRYQSRLSGPILDRMGLKIWIRRSDNVRLPALVEDFYENCTLNADGIRESRQRFLKLLPGAQAFLADLELSLSERQFQRRSRILAASLALLQSAELASVWKLCEERFRDEDRIFARP